MTTRIGPFNINETPDIRPDLRMRLENATAARNQAREQLGFYESEVRALTQLLALEDQRFGSFPQQKEERRPDLPAFIFEKLQKNRMSKDGIRQIVQKAGYDVDGRSIHATLVNLIRGGKVREDGAGTYCAS